MSAVGGATSVATVGAEATSVTEVTTPATATAAVE
jgi:hypothetical protein